MLSSPSSEATFGRREKVDLKDATQPLLLSGGKKSLGADSGVVDENVDAAQASEGRLNEMSAGGRIRDISRNDMGLTSPLFDDSYQLFKLLLISAGQYQPALLAR